MKLNVSFKKTALLASVALLMAAPQPALAEGSATQELNGVSFPTETTLGGKSLKLSGMALRQKRVAFISVDVYVGGLYRATDATGTEHLMRMQFLRDIDAIKIQDSWKESFTKYCVEACDMQEASLKPFVAMLPAVKKGQSLIYAFGTDGVTVRLDDKELGAVKDTTFSKNLLAVFTGPKADPELKKALEGEAK